MIPVIFTLVQKK